MKNLNVRLVIILLVCVGVFVPAVYGLHWWQVRRHAKFFLDESEKAQRAMEEAARQKRVAKEEAARQKGTATEETARKKYLEFETNEASSFRKAINNLRLYAQFQPDDMDALEAMAFLSLDSPYEDPRARSQGYMALQTVVREDPERRLARQKFVELSCLFGNYTVAMEHLNEMLRDYPNDSRLLIWAGICKMRADQSTAAGQYFQRVITASPYEIDAYAYLAAILGDPNRRGSSPEDLKWAEDLQKEHASSPDDWMKKMIEANPDSPQSHWIYAKYLSGLRGGGIDFASNAGIRSHTILVETLVPGVLTLAVEEAIRTRPSGTEDAESKQLLAKRELLADVVKRSLKLGMKPGNPAWTEQTAADVVDASLKTAIPSVPLDDPSRLLDAAQWTRRAHEVDSAVLARSKDEAIKAASGGLTAEDQAVIALADQRGVLVEAMRLALKGFGNRVMMLNATLIALRDEAANHTETAHRLAIAGRQALLLAEKHQVITNALRQVLQPGSDPMDLRQPSQRKVLVDAVTKASGAVAPNSRDAETLAMGQKTILDALREALEDRKVAKRQSDEGGKEGDDSVLSEAAVRATDSRMASLKECDINALLLASEIALLKSDRERAREYLQTAKAAYPTDYRIYSVLAVVDERSQQPEQALSCLQEGLEATDGHYYLLWQMAQLLLDQGKDKESELVIARLQDPKYSSQMQGRIPPQDAAGAFLKARVAFQRKQWLAAVQGLESIRPGLTAYPQVLGQADLLLAQGYRRLMNVEQALAAYRRILASEAGAGTAINEILDFLIQTGRIDEGIKFVRELSARMGNSPQRQFVLAQLLAEQNFRIPANQRDWTEIEAILNRIDSSSSVADQVPILRAKISRALAREEAASVGSTATSTAKPAGPEEVAGSAEKHFDEAEKVLLAARDKNPEKVELWISLLDLAQQREDWKRVEELFGEASKKLGDRVELRLALAEYLVKRSGKEATAQFQKLAQGTKQFTDQERLHLLLGLSGLSLRVGDWGQASKFLDEAEKASGDQVAIRIYRALCLVGRDGPESSKEIVQFARNTEKFSEADRLRLWSALGNLAEQLRDIEQARQLAGEKAKIRPNDLPTRLELFELARQANDDRGMQEAQREIEKIEGQGPNWQYCEAFRLVQQAQDPNDKRMDQALEILDKLQKEQPTWAQVPGLIAFIHSKRGNYDVALTNFQQAVKLGNRNPMVIDATANLLNDRQRYAEADQILALLPRGLGRLSGPVGRRRIEAKMGLGQVDEALAMVKELTAQSKEYQDFVLLGNILANKWQQDKKDGKPAAELDSLRSEAEKAIRQAVDLVPENEAKNVWFMLIQFCAKTEQTTRASELLKEARGKLPAKKADLLEAQCYDFMGKRQQAQSKYEAILANSGDDAEMILMVAGFYRRTGQPDLAEPQLRKIIDGKVKAGQVELALARRGLAEILKGRGGARNLAAAQKLLEQNLAENPASPDDRRDLASLLEPTQPLEAIRIMEALVNEGGTPEDRFKLARLCHGHGDWPKAREQYQALLATNNANAEFIAIYVSGLLQNGELASAEPWMRKLEELEPNSFRTTALQADLLFARGRPRDVIALMQGYLDKRESVPENTKERAHLVAVKLEQLQQRLKKPDEKLVAADYAQKLEQLYNQFAQVRQGTEMQYAAFLGRQGRIDDALSIFEDTWKNCPATAIGLAASTLLKSTAASKEQIKRAEGVFEEALKHHGRALPLLQVLAEVRTKEQRYPEAEAAYREMLKKQSDNTVALNNLAVLLAQQKIKLDESLALINQAIEVAGPLGPLLDSRASVYIAMGKPVEALADMKKSLDEMDTPVRRFHQAQAYDLAGQRDDAVKSMQRAIELGLTEELLEPLERPAFKRLQGLMK